MLAIKSFVNFSEEAKTTLSCFLEPIGSFAIECKRWVFPRPTPPYIISGLKSEDPGVFATLCAAFFAKTLFGPSIKVEKTFAGLILLLFPALLCFVGSSWSSSVDEMFCSDWGAIEILSSRSFSTTLKEDKIISW